MAVCNTWMLALGMVFGVTLALPLDKTNENRVKRSGSEVADIEAQLLRLADKASRTGGGVALEKSLVSSVQSHNGETSVHQVRNNKVLHPQTGKTVAEVKQETEGHKASPSDDMHAQTKTEVDAPEQGLHREWSQREVGEKQTTVDWTANVGVDEVAAYLLQSGDFDGYFSAVEGLVDASTISADRARDYSRQVGVVYRKLQEAQKELEEERTPEEEDTEEAPEEQAAKAVMAAEKKSASSKIPIAEEEEEEKEKEKQEQAEPVDGPAEERDAYVQVMKTTIKRLFKQALIDGDRAAERTLREFIAYVTNLAESGELPVTEVQELLGMMTEAMEEQILSQEETQGATQQEAQKTEEDGKPVEVEEEDEPGKKPQEED